MYLKDYFVDLHIHLGSTYDGKPIKITASKSLTLQSVLEHASDSKGLHLIGVIDCHVPAVLVEMEYLLSEKVFIENVDGGLIYKNKITLLLGSEIELYDENSHSPIHVLVYFPTLKRMKQFSNWLSMRVTNIGLSTQRVYEKATNVQQMVKELEGLFIPAHVFTPFKSLYGKGVKKSLTEVFDPTLIDAVELGLSSDTSMAEQISELAPYPFLTNSDAHSIWKIAREYQKIKMKQPNFSEFKKALLNQDGRMIVCNYGLNPRLGKYYQTTCEKCFENVDETVQTCPNCGHHRFIKGVSARIKELYDNSTVEKKQRPPYIHQVPLQFIPKLGPKTLEKLKQVFKTEMYILHHATKVELNNVVSEKITDYILSARAGTLQLSIGGGGKYGKVK